LERSPPFHPDSHVRARRHLTRTATFVLAEDHRTAPVSAANRAMLHYAVKLTRASASIRRFDVERPDRRRVLARGPSGYLSGGLVLQLREPPADGLGVELEDFWEPEELIITREDLAAASARLRESAVREQPRPARDHDREEHA
jgi:hypothetical protein